MSDTKGLDFTAGVPLRQIPEGAIVAGHVGDDEIVVVRRGDQYFAIGAHCTHYHGPLADGLIVDDTIRCPWHHACFSLRTGEAVRAPALDAIACWRAERRGEMVFAARILTPLPRPQGSGTHTVPDSVVIVGGGAAGFAAADMLRRLGYTGTLTMLSADAAPPVDRPNLSKDYLAGTARRLDSPPVAGVLRRAHIDLQLDARVTSIDLKANGCAGERYDARLRRAPAGDGRRAVQLSLAGAPAIPCTISGHLPTAARSPRARTHRTRSARW